MKTDKYNPDIHHRRSIRLKGYDYSRSGLYFITLCVVDRICVFGNIVDGKMQLNDIGRLVEEEWLNTVDVRNGDVRLHNYIVMPNHFHLAGRAVHGAAFLYGLRDPLPQAGGCGGHHPPVHQCAQIFV